MGRSILTNIKKLLGIAEDYPHYDQDIIMFANSSFMTLMQIGVGPTKGFSITGDSETWEDFIKDRTDLESVITYVYLKTRLLFDPPQSGFLIEAIKQQIAEIEWRLRLQVEMVDIDQEHDGAIEYVIIP